MKNKILRLIIFVLLLCLNYINVNANEIINFDISEIEVKERGNIIIGKNRGIISFADGSNIESDKFIFNKSNNTINFSGNVISLDKKKDIKIYTDFINYNKNSQIINTIGETKVIISSKYILNSSDLTFDQNQKSLFSNKNTNIVDQYQNYYQFEKFIYFINDEMLKATNINFENKINDIKESDNFYFKNGFFDLKNQNFEADDIKIKFNKNLFGNKKNDPRLYAVSAKKKDDVTELNKAIFTSCEIKDDCPPWSLNAKKITHDKNKKLLIYDDAILKVYNVPVLYFPKFFHPDPTVKRQSGLLAPFINKSNIIGSSLQLPYYHVISENKDITIKPTMFNNDIFLIQNEYRFKGKNSLFTGDFGFAKGYESSIQNDKKKNINHVFLKYNHDLSIPEFTKSSLTARIERTNNDTYLKVFGSNLANTINLPGDPNNLSSEVKLELDHEEYNFTTGLNIYENLQANKSDRFQYILPYYSFSKYYFDNIPLGYVNFESKGDNQLINTNNLKSKILNSINYKTYNHYSNKGFINNFGFYIKNLNTIAKNDEIYKSSPQSKMMGLAEFNSSLPLKKIDDITMNSLVPKISLKINPSDMENYSNENSKINYNNLFEVNRLGIENDFEPGNSLTYGVEYKKEKIENINRYFSLSMGSVLRAKKEDNIPKKSTLNNKDSNYFGLVKTKFDDLLDFRYDFSIDNNLSDIEYNSAQLDLNKNNFFSSLNYIKEKGEIGDENIIQGTFGYKIDENNNLLFGTRRNKKIGLTEYYDLIYEYRNDCLTAGIKYKKLYYSDRDLKPTENLLFSITIFPITTFEQGLSGR